MGLLHASQILIDPERKHAPCVCWVAWCGVVCRGGRPSRSWCLRCGTRPRPCCLWPPSSRRSSSRRSCSCCRRQSRTTGSSQGQVRNTVQRTVYSAMLLYCRMYSSSFFQQHMHAPRTHAGGAVRAVSGVGEAGCARGEAIALTLTLAHCTAGSGRRAPYPVRAHGTGRAGRRFGGLRGTAIRSRLNPPPPRLCPPPPWCCATRGITTHTQAAGALWRTAGTPCCARSPATR